jgi:hypothetical protein
MEYFRGMKSGAKLLQSFRAQHAGLLESEREFSVSIAVFMTLDGS